ncbi:uridylate kinase PUMPKIN, chloroplastic-like [Rutidosis leptorrhynchoides]|uniref:uridylate kinase PUMPKIN, chloroplastic-like n=1 Tax=Rutidosis leptorrhynchoides TaxID=125765 RepID=UPI003A993C49
MASSTNVESPPINEGSNNGDTPVTESAAAVSSPVTPAAVNSAITPAPVTSGENLTTSMEIDVTEERRIKKPKHDSGGGTDPQRKNREEWSESEVAILLDAFTDKYLALNRSLLRFKDWKVVADLVEDCDDKKSHKSVEQCKNKVDNLKKRYKLETQRLESNDGVSKWIWFKKMEKAFGDLTASKTGNATATKSPAIAVSDEDDDRSFGVSSPTNLRRSTRLAPNDGLFPRSAKSSANVKWKRVVFKVSGTALTGRSQNIDPKVALQIAKEVATASRSGVEVAIIIGGRNFFCGDSWVSATDLDRPTAYQIGMMATVMNSILLQSALEKLGIQTRVQSAFVMPEVAEPYNRLRAMRHLSKGRVVIFGGVGAGTGNPLFTTDTAAALRASEINADAVIKGTSVNGIVEKKVTLDKISYRDAVSKDVSSMDLMAIQFCEENEIPVVIFNMLEPGNVSKALRGIPVGTLIDQ